MRHAGPRRKSPKLRRQPGWGERPRKPLGCATQARSTAPGTNLAQRPSPPANDAILALENVTLRIGTQSVFSKSNWTIRAGEHWAILGPNNSGKSLLAATVAGEVLPTRGEINMKLPAGTASSPHPPVALVSPHTHRSVATAESSFYQSRWHSGLGEGRFTVSQFLSQESVEQINPFEVRPHRTARRAFVERRHSSIRRLRLEPLLRRKLMCLSNGEMRRTLLARALLQAPRWLVLDEPFAGLDVATRRHLTRVIESLIRDGISVIMVTSRFDEIPKVSTHLLLVDRHRIIAQGSRAVVLKHPLVKRLQAAARAPLPLAGHRKRNPLSTSSKMSGAPLVEIHDATVRFGTKRILEGVSWTIRRGEHWALSGPNGSGKTTLLSLIQGDNPQAYSQNMRWFGTSPDSNTTLWQMRRRIGWFSPELHLHYPPEWSCLDVVCSGFFDSIGLFEHCSSRQRNEGRRLLAQLGLARHSRTALGELSFGDQRLVLLARALVKRPQLLVLDEPCQSLDAAHRRLILTTVDRVVSSLDASLVFVTHYHREIPTCITHLLQLKAGRVLYHGPLR